MARTKQPTTLETKKPAASSNRKKTIEVADSDSEDEMNQDYDDGDEEEAPVKATMRSTVLATAGNTGGGIGKGKGKSKAGPTIQTNETDLDEEIATIPVPRIKAVPVNLNIPNPAPSREVEKLRKNLEAVTKHRDQLQGAVDELIQLQNTQREQDLLEQVQALQVQVKTQAKLIQELKSDYTRSKLLPQSRGTVVDFITRETASLELQDATTKLSSQLKEAEVAQRRAETLAENERKNAKEIQKQMVSLQRELEMEVSNSKKLQAEMRQRPGGSQKADRTVAVSMVDKKKLQFYEDLTGLGIVTLVETPNTRSETFTCILTVDEKELSFKLGLFDGNGSGDLSQESQEHVVYTPNDPIDPDLERALDYLARPFTFPRTQMAVFFQNLYTALTSSGLQASDEGDMSE